MIAALSYTFTDSFWYNAVEAEVYAMGSLFIAVLVWLGLKWEEELDTPRGNKWLVLISFSNRTLFWCTLFINFSLFHLLDYYISSKNTRQLR